MKEELEFVKKHKKLILDYFVLDWLLTFLLFGVFINVVVGKIIINQHIEDSKMIIDVNADSLDVFVCVCSIIIKIIIMIITITIITMDIITKNIIMEIIITKNIAYLHNNRDHEK